MLHATLDFRRAIDVPGYDRVEVDPAARFIGTMNYGYAGTRELNEALTSRFAVIQMPAIDGDGLDRLLGEEFPSLEKKYRGQFVQLFLDLQKKCESAEISSKALDLRGMLDALRLIRRGINAGTALDMGITNKAFDSYEQGLIRDVIAARIPAKLDRSRLFTDWIWKPPVTAPASGGPSIRCGLPAGTTNLNRSFWPCSLTASLIFI